MAKAKQINKTPILAIILVSYFMIVLDISMVITALPKIRFDLSFSPTGLSWVQNSYTLAFGGLLLLGARAGDILGRKRMFAFGLALFTSGSFGVGMAPSMSFLIGCRVMQGVGAAIFAPSTLAILQINFVEGQERTRAVAYYGAVTGVATSIGLVLGGIFADLLSWRIGFFVNLPIGICLILAIYRYIEETPKRSGHFDFLGAFSSVFGMSALVYGIVRSATYGWDDQVTNLALIIGAILLLFLILNEKHAKEPIMPLHLFANSERSTAYAARVLLLGAIMGFWFFMTQFLQEVMGFRPLTAGFAFLPTTITSFISALYIPKLTKKFGNINVLVIGIATTLIGMVFLSRISVDSSYFPGIALPMILFGIGQGMSIGPLTAAAIVGVHSKDAGAASGMVNVAHQLGCSLGLSILIVIFAHAGTEILEPRASLAHKVSSVLTASSIILMFTFALVCKLALKHSPILANSEKSD